MNTKTDGISSGLVAVAWMDYNTSSPESWSLHKVAAQPRESDIANGFRCDPLVRLSDAEAIIAAKDAEIERLKKEATTWLNGSNINQAIISQQAERIKELEYVLAPIKESSEIAEKAGRTALEWVEYAKQLETDLGGAVGAENSRLRSKVAKQSAALKRAKDALIYHTEQTRPIQKTIEALAAIDEVLKGE